MSLSFSPTVASVSAASPTIRMPNVSQVATHWPSSMKMLVVRGLLITSTLRTRPQSSSRSYQHRRTPCRSHPLGSSSAEEPNDTRCDGAGRNEERCQRRKSLPSLHGVERSNQSGGFLSSQTCDRSLEASSPSRWRRLGLLACNQ